MKADEISMRATNNKRSDYLSLMFASFPIVMRHQIF